jgi:hypothetical protein
MDLPESYPYDPESFNAAAWVVVRGPSATADQYRQALEHPQFVCRLAGEELPYVINLGVAQYRAGQYHEAIDTLTRAEKNDTRTIALGERPRCEKLSARGRGAD